MTKVAGTQIKVRAGQVSECDVIGGPSIREVRKVICNDPYHDDVFFECANHMTTSDLCSCGKFIPQNDLEELAIKLDKWYCASRFLRIKQGVPFICDEHDEGAIHVFAWRNMRYYLGLDKKPHYRLIDGEWVKQ